MGSCTRFFTAIVITHNILQLHIVYWYRRIFTAWWKTRSAERGVRSAECGVRSVLFTVANHFNIGLRIFHRAGGLGGKRGVCLKTFDNFNTEHSI